MEDEDPFDGHEPENEAAVDLLMGWDAPACTTCGSAMGSDPVDKLNRADGLPGLRSVRTGQPNWTEYPGAGLGRSS